VLGHPKLFPEQRLRGRCAEGDDYSRLQQADLLLEPGITRADLSGGRLLVQAPSAFDHHELEVFD
jgi:hypothetical protein